MPHPSSLGRAACRIALAASALIVAAPAQAAMITSESAAPLAFSWDHRRGGDHLTGNGMIVVSGFNSASLRLEITLSNTSIMRKQRLLSFGFGIDGNASAVEFEDAHDRGMVDAVLQSRFGAGIRGVEVCIRGGRSCAGGGQAILGGRNDSFVIALAGDWGSAVDITPLAFRYGTASTPVVFALKDAAAAGPLAAPTPAPEPASLALFGIAMVGLGTTLCQRRRLARVPLGGARGR